MSYEEYTWQRYYEDLYHRQKKENNALAVELGETEMKVAELEIALNRVVGSPFWKVLSPARKLYKKLSGNSEATRTINAESDENERLFKKRCEEFENRYAHWIENDEIEKKYSQYPLESPRLDEIAARVYKISECIGISSPVDNCEGAKWLVFTGDSGILARGFAERLKDALIGRDEVEILYADEDYACYSCDGTEISRINPYFKPDWSPDTLVSYFYFGNFVMIRSDLAKKTKWKASDDGLLNVYDMFLQAAKYIGTSYNDTKVMHIPQVMYHNIIDEEEYEASASEDIQGKRIPRGCGAKYNSIKQCEMIPGQDPDVYHPCYPVPEDTLISVLILSKDHPEVLKNCLSSFVERTEYAKLEFIIVDNGSTTENRSKYETIIEETIGIYPHKYIYQPMDFNFSKQCNIAAENAEGELLLFLNDDIEIIQKDWLKLMAGYALLQEAAFVGAKLLYANTDKIQHAGVTNMKAGPSHKLTTYSDAESYYYGKNIVDLNVLAVTAACMMVRKSTFNKIGKYDESFAVAYNDVDLCMRAVEAGYHNIQCNGAVLYHYESMSRGLDETNDNKWNRLLDEKKRLMDHHGSFEGWDPYYNVNLVGDDLNYLCNYRFGYENKTKYQIVRQYSARLNISDARKLAKNNEKKWKFSIDYAGQTRAQSLGEPVNTEVRGWCFESGRDNFDRKVSVLLLNTNGEGVAEAFDHKNDGSAPNFVFETEVMPREELAEIFKNECHVTLCGFDAKILNKEVNEGTYRVALMISRLNDDLAKQNGDYDVVLTDTFLTI